MDEKKLKDFQKIRSSVDKLKTDLNKKQGAFAVLTKDLKAIVVAPVGKQAEEVAKKLKLVSGSVVKFSDGLKKLVTKSKDAAEAQKFKKTVLPQLQKDLKLVKALQADLKKLKTASNPGDLEKSIGKKLAVMFDDLAKLLKALLDTLAQAEKTTKSMA